MNESFNTHIFKILAIRIFFNSRVESIKIKIIMLLGIHR